MSAHEVPAEFKDAVALETMRSRYGAVLDPVWNHDLSHPELPVRASVIPDFVNEIRANLLKSREPSDSFSVSIVYVPTEGKSEAIFLGVAFRDAAGKQAVALYEFDEKEGDFAKEAVRKYREAVKESPSE